MYLQNDALSPPGLEKKILTRSYGQLSFFWLATRMIWETSHDHAGTHERRSKIVPQRLSKHLTHLSTPPFNVKI